MLDECADRALGRDMVNPIPVRRAPAYSNGRLSASGRVCEASARRARIHRQRAHRRAKHETGERAYGSQLL
jgi:hypothetical protein